MKNENPKRSPFSPITPSKVYLYKNNLKKGRAHESRTICAIVRFLEVPRAQNIGQKPSLCEMDETLSRTKFRKL